MYAELKNKLLSEIEGSEFLLGGSKDSAIIKKRVGAIKYFSGMDFPTKKNEDWKYDDLKFLENDYKVCLEKEDTDITPKELQKFLFEGLDDNILVFVNGFLSKELSQIVSDEIVFESMSEARKNHKELVDKHYAAYTNDEAEPFTALNTASAPDGAFVYVPDGVILEKKIHLLFLTDAKKENVLVQPRNLIIAGRNSQSRFIQTCYTFGEHIGFTNLVTEIVIGEDAMLGFYKIHNCLGNAFYIGTTETSQEQGSTYNNASISLKGKFQRNNINTVFNGERCEANLYGFYLTDGTDFVNNRTLVDHAVPNCISNENYKGIIDGHSKAVFNGKIVVREDAQKTEAYQSNKNILLSDDAVIDTKPQLEINADDVKCSHGATSGNLDKEAMFYLKARGVSEDKARALLLNAFASDIIKNVHVHALRDFIKRQIAERLTKGDIYFCKVLESN